MRKLNLLLLLSFFAACAPEIAQDTPLPSLIARFDPSAGVIPLPNNALLDPGCADPATCRLSVPTRPTDSGAQADFNAYLNTLTGFPAQSTVTIPMGGPISEASLNDTTVPVIDCGLPALPDPYARCASGDLVPVVRTFDSVTRSIVIRPASGAWRFGHTYAVAVMGGKNGLKGATGEETVADAAFYFLRGEKKIDTPQNAEVLPGDTIQEKMESARALERLRANLIAPAIDALEGRFQDFDRDRLASLTVFTITRETYPVLDLAASQLPLPNDLLLLLLDPVNHSLRVPTRAQDPRLSEAEDAFRKYINAQDGFLPAQAASVAFTAPLDVEVMQRDAEADLRRRPVVVWDATAGAPVDVTREVTAGETWLFAPRGAGGKRAYWTPGHRYIVGVFGGAEGLLDEEGRAVVASPQYALVRGTNPLVDGSGKSLVSTLTNGQAAALENVRKALAADIATLLTATGRKRSELALSWSFTVSSRTQAGLDQAAGLTPFPTNALLSPLTGKVVLPSDACSEAGPLCGAVQQLDGFSTTGDITIPFTGEVDLASAQGAGAIKLFALGVAGPDLTPAALPVFTVRSLKGMPGLGVPTLALTPTAPLKDATTYLGVVTRKVLDAAGRPVVPSPTMQLLLSTDSLTDGAGKSKVSTLTNEQAAQLEALRPGIHQLVGTLELTGQATRGDIALLWTFRTQTIGASLALERTQNYGDTRGPSTAGATQLLEVPLSTLTGLGFPTGNLARVYAGTFKTWVHAPGVTPRVDSPSVPRETVPYLLAVPSAADPGGNPVAIVLHGLQGEKLKALALADALAAKKIATLAIDLPNHGERAVCESDAHCGAATGTARCDLTTAPVFRLGPPMTNPTGAPGVQVGGACVCTTPGSCTLPAVIPPLRSASAFAWGIRLDSPSIVRDAMRQAALDVAQVVRLLRDGSFQEANHAAGGTVELNPLPATGGAIHLVGYSLGSMVAAIAGSIEPHVRTAALLNPGGTIIDILSTAPSYATLWGGFLALVGAPAGSYKEFSLKRLYKWVIDAGDPLNFARTLVTSPLPFDDHPDPPGPQPGAAKRVYLQLTVNDPTVPNSATFRFFDAMIPDVATRSTLSAAGNLLYSPWSVQNADGTPAHAFAVEGALNAIGLAKRALAQEELAAFLAEP